MRSEGRKVTYLVFLGIGLVVLIFLVPVSITAKPPVDRGEGSGVAQASDMVFVPAGPFSMGCAEDYKYLLCDADASPIHTVYLDAFFIDETEVTNRQYRACVEAGVCDFPLSNGSETRSNYFSNPYYEDYPVINVDWRRAVAYCQWVGKRLPTEAEWEKAARGTDIRWFPWGNGPHSCDLLNYGPCVGDTVAVRSYPMNVSPYGAFDMVGNVSEWVNDFYASRYYEDSPYYNPQGPEITSKKEHLVRGGSWAECWRGITTYVRLDESEIYKVLRIGIRCAKSLEGPTPTPTSTPTPRPTLTPAPTPTPFAASIIGAEGGALWLANPEHLTLLNVPPAAVDANTTFTLSFDGRSNLQGDLQGIDHFFRLDARASVPPSGTASISDSLGSPLRLTLGFVELGGVKADALDIYRLDSSAWLTTDIAVVERTNSHLVAWIEQTGIYGLLGETNRVYLPIVLRSSGR